MRTGTSRIVGWLLVLRLLSAATPLMAHPMGNFSINHYTRLEPHAKGSGVEIEGRYILDIAEIPTVTEMNRLDTNQDGKVSDTERAAYLQNQCAELGRKLSLSVDGRTVPLTVRAENLAMRPGAGGLQTLRLVLKLQAHWAVPSGGSSLPPSESTCTVAYRDDNFSQRTGWKEIVVRAPSGTLRECSVSADDISKELTVYPSDPSIAPPQITQARFTLLLNRQDRTNQDRANQDRTNQDRTYQDRTYQGRASGEMGEGNLTPATTPPVSSSAPATPQDRFTQSIAAQDVTPIVGLLALMSAFLFGALHALSPGHGKTMVAAYLVGTRGTAWHAVLLGLVVTLTHTLGVFLLGLVTLSASQHIVPEKLYPILSGLSGLGVAGMGIGLFWSRLAAWRAADGGADREMEADKSVKAGSSESPYEEASLPERISASDTDIGDEFLYQRRNGSDAVSLRTLIGLGITGGALPCPSALVVMLSAIALHRIAFGLLLIVAFSLGLAVVLTVMGLLVMRMRGVFERVPARQSLMEGLSVVSAAVVALIGIVLVVRALHGSF